MKKVVLFLPPYSGEPLGPPAGLLSLASPLIRAGYRVAVIDAAVSPDYLAAIESKIGDAICFGVSLLTGPMIKGAVSAALLVKKLRPQMPVVFGGWHPSLLPDQTLHEDFVDVVVRNQGEITFLELVRNLECGRNLRDVAGCSYKSDGRVRHNPGRPVTRLNDLAAPAYHLVDFDAYEKACGARKLPYASSVGCPYACNYCTDTVFYNRRFNALSACRVVKEVTALSARHRIEEVALLDSNFLVDARRAVEIARGFSDARAAFRWTFQASTDLLCRLSDDEVRLLGSSGVRHIGFGVESGSEEVLVRMNKRHQRIADMFETARKCSEAGIRATFNVIFGFPGETESDRHQTLEVMREVAARFDNVTFSPNIFTPYPGIPIWNDLRALGVREPQTLEEWTNLSLGANVLPWLRGSECTNIERSMSFFLLSNNITKAARRSGSSRLARLVLGSLKKALNWRMNNHCFHWPLELWLLKRRHGIALRRSLLTGQALGHSLKEAC